MQKETPSDTTLADDIRRGESVAETAIYENFAARVYYLALSELQSREDSEDVRVETFLRVIKALRNGQLRPPRHYQVLSWAQQRMSFEKESDSDVRRSGSHRRTTSRVMHSSSIPG